MINSALTSPARRARLVLAVTVALLASLLVVPVAAHADGSYCGNGFVVRGEIQKKYVAVGGPGGVLGCPRSNENTTPNRVGKFTTFANGSIYWTAATGAHTVYGVIGAKWGALRYEAGALGFPTSDELTNADGRGKRQIYQGGTIYWHPDASNGAHAVWGEIGRKWGARGYDNGDYGYPVSDEFSTASGLRQDFQRGSIVWRSDIGFRYSYVALGDSFSAGTGAEDDGTDCHRSGNAYGPLLNRDAGQRVYSFEHAACAGAKTANVIDSQLSSLHIDTDVVTLTIGGNDGNLVGVLASCANPFHGSCNPELDQATDFVANELPARLDRTLAAIHAKSPTARVLVGGYPLLFSDPFRGGPSLVGDIDSNEARRGNELGNLLNNTIRAAVGRSPRTVFVDPRQQFTGHEVDSADRWLNPVENYFVNFESNGLLHPNVTGQRYGYEAVFSAPFQDALT